MSSQALATVSSGLRVPFEQLGGCRLSLPHVLFPRAPRTPGVYRIEFASPGDRSLYIGETANLQSRFHHYERPGPTQWTNLRIRARVLEVLGRSGLVTVFIARSASAERNGAQRSLNLTDVQARRGVEAALLDRAVGEGCVVENRRLWTLLEGVNLAAISAVLALTEGAQS